MRDVFESESGQIAVGLLVMAFGFAGAIIAHLMNHKDLDIACVGLIGTGVGWIGRSMGTAKRVSAAPEKGELTK